LFGTIKKRTRVLYLCNNIILRIIYITYIILYRRFTFKTGRGLNDSRLIAYGHINTHAVYIGVRVCLYLFILFTWHYFNVFFVVVPIVGS